MSRTSTLLVELEELGDALAFGHRLDGEAIVMGTHSHGDWHLGMRLQDKVMAVCIPHVLSTQKSLEEVQRTMTVTITKQHLDFATLMFDVISSNEEVLFGQMLQDFLVNEKRDKKVRNTYDKTAKFYKLLPDTFTTQNVKEIWGFSTISTASNKCNLFEEQKIIHKIAQGKYQKLVSAI